MSDQATALQSDKLRRRETRRAVPNQPTAEAFALNSRQRFRATTHGRHVTHNGITP